MALQTNASVMAVKKETTEGTPVVPASGADFVALQEGFSVAPNFDALEYAELTGSIGAAKNVKGLENPTFSFSHYIRGSGAVATQPDYGDYIENAMGAVAVRATERDTIVGSTVSAVNVNTGEGAEFVRGDAILVKHAANAWEIRNVLSVSGDVLTLAQNLANAPGTAVNLGRNVRYYPVNTGHPTHSVWVYRGNAAGGAVELVSGTRVTSMAIDVTAGDFVNATFDCEGIRYYYNPITLTTNIYLDFDDGGGEENAVVAAKTYRDPYELADAIAAAMNALTGDTITVTYNDRGVNAGKFTIASDGAQLDLLWNTGTNTANTLGTAIGFAVAADDTGALTYTSDNVVSKAAPYTPSFNAVNPLVAKDNQVIFGSDPTQTSCFKASTLSVTVANTKSNILSVCSESGVSGSVVSERAITVELTALLEDHQALEFKNFRANDTVLFTFNTGEKSGGNWVEGKTVNFHSPTMVIDSINLDDTDGLVTLSMTLTAFVSSGLNEFFVNLL